MLQKRKKAKDIPHKIEKINKWNITNNEEKISELQLTYIQIEENEDRKNEKEHIVTNIKEKNGNDIENTILVLSVIADAYTI